jgi:hypothetical protein
MSEDTTKFEKKFFHDVAVVEIFGFEGDITVFPTAEHDNGVVVDISGPAWLVDRVQLLPQGRRLLISMREASLNNFFSFPNGWTIGAKRPPFDDFQLNIEIGSQVSPHIEDTVGQVIVKTSCKDVFVKSKRPGLR